MTTASDTNDKIRALLINGYTYDEIKSAMGVASSQISHAKRPLDEDGIAYQKKSPEKLRASKIRSMGNGSVMQILYALTDEELDDIYALSAESWAKAILIALRTKR